MDQAVALVQAYLNVNGYFTVVEYPMLEVQPKGGWRAATDLDVLAFRFPGAGRLSPEHPEPKIRGTMAFEPDPELGVAPEAADMIVGEVKEGRAEFNSAVRDPAVLSAALARFGCCTLEERDRVTQRLLHQGDAKTESGHRIRMIAFGARADAKSSPAERVITTGHIVKFLRSHLTRHWKAFSQAQFKAGTLGFLALLEKAERGRH